MPLIVTVGRFVFEACANNAALLAPCTPVVHALVISIYVDYNRSLEFTSFRMMHGSFQDAGFAGPDGVSGY